MIIIIIEGEEREENFIATGFEASLGILDQKLNKKTRAITIINSNSNNNNNNNK